MKCLTLPCLLAVAAVATGYASATPAPTAPTSAAATDCRQLGAELATAEEARSAGLKKMNEAWKAVIPFAVAARYAGGKAEAGKANQRLDGLRAQYRRQDCDRHSSFTRIGPA